MKYFIFLILMLIVVPTALAADITREMLSSADQAEEIEVKLQLTNAAPGEKAVVGELLPEGAEIISWEIQGGRDAFFSQEERSFVWEFIAESETPTISYVVKLPENGVLAKFDAVYAVPPNEFGNTKFTINLNPLPVAPVPVPVPPAVETPLSQPVPVSGVPLIVGLIAMFAAAMGVFSYLRTRVSQYKPTHTSFVDQMKRLAASSSTYVGLRFGLIVPETQATEQVLSPRQEIVMDHLPAEQDRILQRIDRVERSLPVDDKEDRMLLEELKNELLAIRFVYEDV